jgi:hypothetical protein
LPEKHIVRKIAHVLVAQLEDERVGRGPRALFYSAITKALAKVVVARYKPPRGRGGIVELAVFAEAQRQMVIRRRRMVAAYNIAEHDSFAASLKGRRNSVLHDVFGVTVVWPIPEFIKSEATEDERDERDEYLRHIQRREECAGVAIHDDCVVACMKSGEIRTLHRPTGTVVSSDGPVGPSLAVCLAGRMPSPVRSAISHGWWVMVDYFKHTFTILRPDSTVAKHDWIVEKSDGS